MPSHIESVGVIGSSGAFGTFIIERLKAELAGLDVRSYDPKNASSTSFERVASADVVIPAVPPLAFETVLLRTLPHMTSRSTLFDVCTVKLHTLAVLRKHRVPSFAATHQLFGPQSFIDNGHSLRGLQMALCESDLAPVKYTLIRRFLERLGLQIIEMTADEHDRGPGIEQLTVQFYGLINRRTGLVRNEYGFHTKSAEHFLRAMEIVKNDEVLFQQVAALNPYWPAARERIERAFQEVLAKKGNGT